MVPGGRCLKCLPSLRGLEPAARPRWLMMIRRDRLSRGTIADSQVVLHELRKMGVSVWTRDQGEIKMDTATDEMIDAIHSVVARQENEVRSEKSRAVYNRKRRLANASAIDSRMGCAVTKTAMSLLTRSVPASCAKLQTTT
jgi:hypothetical protein